LLLGILRYVLESKNIFYTATVFTILQEMIESLGKIYFLYFQKYQQKDILHTLADSTITVIDHMIVEELLTITKEIDLIYRFYQLLSNKRYLNSSISETLFTIIELFVNQIQSIKQKVVVKQQLGLIINDRIGAVVTLSSELTAASSIPSVTDDHTIIQKFVSLDLQYQQQENTETGGETNDIVAGKSLHRRIITICQQLIAQIRRSKSNSSSASSSATINNNNQDANKEKPKRNRKRPSSQEGNTNKNKVAKIDQPALLPSHGIAQVPIAALPLMTVPLPSNYEDETVMV
jgi:hypothetical protein